MRTKPSKTFYDFKRWWAANLNEFLLKTCRVRLTEDEAFKIFEMAFLATIQWGVQRYHKIVQGLMPTDEETLKSVNKDLLLSFPGLGKAGVQLRKHKLTSQVPIWAGVVPRTPRFVLTLSSSIKNLLLKELAGIDVEVLRANEKKVQKVFKKVFKK